MDTGGIAKAIGDKVQDLLQMWSGEICHNILVTADIKCQEETWLVLSSAIAAWGGGDSILLRDS